MMRSIHSPRGQLPHEFDPSKYRVDINPHGFDSYIVKGIDLSGFEWCRFDDDNNGGWIVPKSGIQWIRILLQCLGG